MQLLNRIVSVNSGVHSVVFTFRENPERFFNVRYKGDISTVAQKLAIMEDIGIENVILIDFSSDFSKLRGEQFFSDIKESLILSKIVVGYDFKCGNGNDTDASDIDRMFKKSGVDVEVIPEFVYMGTPVKSTMIRTFIKVGELNILPELMDYGYSIDITGFSGSMKRSDSKQVLPASGSFSLKLFDGGVYRNAAITADETAVRWEFI